MQMGESELIANASEKAAELTSPLSGALALPGINTEDSKKIEGLKSRTGCVDV
jgi:hypothetical protein